MTSAEARNECVDQAGAIVDVGSLRAWLAGPLKAFLPHEAVLVGQSIAHSGGLSTVQRWSFDLPPAHEACINAPNMNIRSPIFTRLLKSGGPVFFDAARDGAGMNTQWLARFRGADLHNILGLNFQDGEGDALLVSSAGFYNVPPDIESRAAELQRTVMPHLHAALCRIEVAAASESTRGNALGLAPGERAIVDLLMQGMSNKEIARKLGNSDQTVKHRLALLMRRLDVHKRAGLATLVSNASRS